LPTVQVPDLGQEPDPEATRLPGAYPLPAPMVQRVGDDIALNGDAT
jgi:hypothetical protein